MTDKTECDWCHSAVTGLVQHEKQEICRLCYTTYAGNIIYQRSLSNDSCEIIQAILQVGNILREELLAQRRASADGHTLRNDSGGEPT